MAAFLMLIIVFGALHLVSRVAFRKFLSDHRTKGRIAMAVMLLFTATRHFTHPEEFVAMMPAFLPFPSELVFVSGVFEILGAMGLIVRKFQRRAGLCLALFFVAIFPANINVALNSIAPPGGLPSAPWYLWLRLAFQPLFIWWALRCTNAESKRPSPAT